MSSNRRRLERQGAEDGLRGRLDAMQRLTQGFRVAIVELNVISGVYARPDIDRGADDERQPPDVREVLGASGGFRAAYDPAQISLQPFGMRFEQSGEVLRAHLQVET